MCSLCAIVKRKGLEHAWILAFMGDSGVNPRILRDDCFTCCFQEDFLTRLLSISIFISLELEDMFGILKNPLITAKTYFGPNMWSSFINPFVSLRGVVSNGSNILQSPKGQVYCLW